MPFNPEQLAALAAPLHPQHVAKREQSGRKLSYIEGWHAIAEANRIFGFDAWDRELLELRLVAERAREIGAQKNPGWSVSYIARVRVTVYTRGEEGTQLQIIKEGVGAGHGIDRDLGLAHESASKEAETDAMKRALMMFGNPFGLALYDKTQANVSAVDTNAIEAFEKGIDEAETEGVIDDLLTANGPALSALYEADSAEWQRLSRKVRDRKALLKDLADTATIEGNKQ